MKSLPDYGLDLNLLILILSVVEWLLHFFFFFLKL